MSNSTHLFPLHWGFLAVGIAIFSYGTSLVSFASEPADVATLRIHPIRATNVGRVVELVTSIVPNERVVPMSASRELAVFAVPSVQNAIAERIALHEKNALLFERIDLVETDPQVVRVSIQNALRHETAQKAESPMLKRSLKFEIDARKKQLLVWGGESQINFVKDIVLEAERDAKDRRKMQQIADANHAAEPVQSPQNHESTMPPIDSRTADGLLGQSKRLLVPRGPVRVVHVKGLDLLLIRSRGGGDQRLPVPSGNVKIGP